MTERTKEAYAIQVDFMSVTETFYDFMGYSHTIEQALMYIKQGAISVVVIDNKQPYRKIFIAARINTN